MFKRLLLATTLLSPPALAQQVLPPVIPAGASILPLNNTWTGTNTFNNLVVFNTPTSPISISSYNASGSSTTVSATCVSGNTSLTLGSAGDFKNNQGIRLNACGATYSLNQPTSLTVTATCTGTCTTTYTYSVSAMDAAGGFGAPLATATASNSTPINPNSQTGTNFNTVSWAAPTGTAPWGYIVWGNTGGTPAFLGITTGTSWKDVGNAGQRRPDWIPATMPGGGQNDALVTTITAGGGSTTLTLAAAPSQGIATNAYHDDTAAIQAAVTAAATGNHAISIPPTPAFWPISSPISLPTTTPGDFFGPGRDAGCIQSTLPMAEELLLPIAGGAFPNGGSIHRLCLDGFGLAQHNIFLADGANFQIEDSYAVNVVRLTNIQLGDGTHSAINEQITNTIAGDLNVAPSALGTWDCGSISCLPFANIDVANLSANNYITSTIGIGASVNNFEDEVGSSSQFYNHDHGYPWPVNIAGTYNLGLNGAFSTVVGFEADGATIADITVACASYFNNISDSSLQFANIPGTPNGIVLQPVNGGCAAAYGNKIHNNRIRGLSAGNAIINNSGNSSNSACDNLVDNLSTMVLATYANLCN